MTAQAAVLLVLLFTGHFLGDFTPLATARMQEAKIAGTPLGPIALHALIHAALVGLVAFAIVRPDPTLLAAACAIEFWTHFGLDWFRGRLGAGRPKLTDPSTQAFWTAMGLDQLAHALVLIGITALLLI